MISTTLHPGGTVHQTALSLCAVEAAARLLRDFMSGPNSIRHCVWTEAPRHASTARALTPWPLPDLSSSLMCGGFGLLHRQHRGWTVGRRLASSARALAPWSAPPARCVNAICFHIPHRNAYIPHTKKAYNDAKSTGTMVCPSCQVCGGAQHTTSVVKWN